jgi:hypothetical protein
MDQSTTRLVLTVPACLALLAGACTGAGNGSPAGEEIAAPRADTTASEQAAAPADARIRVLIIDGVNNHDWERTTAATRATLEHSGRFVVEVSTSPTRDASREEWAAWRPRFADYDVVVSNFNDDCRQEGGCESLWSASTKEDLEKFVREGGGFVAVHAADNHDANWLAYNEMIGVGGWGGRQAGVHGSILRKVEGEWEASSPNEGGSGAHGRRREFLIIHDQPEHPILAGLPPRWMHAEDELYASLRGPAVGVEVLAHARSLLTNEDEPMIMLIEYGEGTVFHLPLGHYAGDAEPPGASLLCVGFQTILARGTEFAATGQVTIGVPESFPGPDAAVVIPPADVIW